MLKKRAARSKPSKLDKGKNDRVGIAIVMVLVGIPLCVFVSVAFVPLLSRFDEVYQFVTTAEIDKVGSFLGAIGGPLALYLIFLGLLLQSRQFLLLSDQVNMLRKQHEDEYQRSLPRLILQEIGLSGESRQFVIRNIGGAARELQLEWGDWDNVASSDKKSQQLEKIRS